HWWLGAHPRCRLSNAAMRPNPINADARTTPPTAREVRGQDECREVGGAFSPSRDRPRVVEGPGVGFSSFPVVCPGARLEACPGAGARPDWEDCGFRVPELAKGPAPWPAGAPEAALSPPAPADLPCDEFDPEGVWGGELVPGVVGVVL